ncbi:hypothetical protein [Clostridium baratii]|uniref:hypothetical protein n=1 Tax=Clostridium baratii TaxID=1561 RepID=UPI0030D44CB3
MLNTEKSKKEIIYLVPLMLLLPVLGEVLYNLKFNNLPEYYTKELLFKIQILWWIECLFFTLLVDRGLYKNVKNVEPATNQEFRQAIMSNKFRTNFSDKKVTVGKKRLAWIFTLSILLLTIYLLWSFYTQKILLYEKIDKDIILVSLYGMLPFGSS